MTFYPVIIYTLNRYEHFRRCVESLARNTHAEQTELVIGLDYPPSEKYVEGHRKIKDYLPTITGFKKVTVFERTENYGAYRNGMALREHVFSRYDAVITTEDDNEFAPCFLDYTNKMLEHYKDDKRVASVSGFLHPEYYNKSKTGLVFTKESNGWGNGLWKDRRPDEDERYEIVYRLPHSFSLSWKSLTTFPAAFRMTLNMIKQQTRWGDASRTQINIINGTYQVRPAVSLVRNWGYDGSGINCRVDKTLEHQTISTAKIFEEPTSWEPFYSREVARATFHLTWPKNPFLFAGKILITIGIYLRFRMK